MRAKTNLIMYSALFSFRSLSQEVQKNSDYSYDNDIGDKPWAFDSQNFCLCYIKVKEKKTTFILCLLNVQYTFECITIFISLALDQFNIL